MNKFRILEITGDGTYGVVYKGINTETNEQIAIKKLKDKISSWNECLQLNEVRILRKLNHENIVKLHEIIREQNSNVNLIFEYADTNLYQYIDSFRKSNQFIPEHKIKNIIYQIISGINYLHKQGIMHRDLKPENILIMNNTNQVKIADFGVAKEIPSFSAKILTDYVCTRWYRAPECVLKSHEYNESIDVWAIGCIMAEMYNLKPFFAGVSEFDQLDKICNVLGTPTFNDWPDGFKHIQRLGMKFPNCNTKDLHSIIRNASNDAISMLQSIFVWDWKKRPKCEELLNHRFFNENRPATYSYGNRFERRNNNNMSPLNGNNHYGYHNNNNNSNNVYRSSVNGADRNELEIVKNADSYLRNLNFWNYQNNGGVVPDLNNLFKKDPFVNNMGYYIGRDKDVMNSNNNNNMNVNSNMNGTKNFYPIYNNTQSSKNTFSSLAESNIINNRKYIRNNSSYVPISNQGNDYNSNNIISKYNRPNYYRDSRFGNDMRGNSSSNMYIPNNNGRLFHKPSLDQFFNSNLYV